MTQAMTTSVERPTSPPLEQRIRERIEALSYLPTTVAVAMKFMELGRDPDAEPSEYARVVSADSALSTKLLALVNSSWFGVRYKVTKVPAAVNLLGLGTVRTLALSYCMTGLHNELRLNEDESRMFWEAALCKAISAKLYARQTDARLGDEAFAAGLFQDLALPVMYAMAKPEMTALLEDPAADWRTRLQKERDVFGLDHTELGRLLAQKLELPDLFVDTIAFHHNYESLTEFIDGPVLARSVHVSSLLPHLLGVWNREDGEEMRRVLEADASDGSRDPVAYLAAVQQEFEQLYRFFEDGNLPRTRLADLMESTAREVADNTTQLVGQVNEMLQQAARSGMALNQLLAQRDQLADKAVRDRLTGVLNREGFTNQAGDLIAKAARYGTNFAVVYLDVDRFKPVNDTYGHEVGDRVLQAVAQHMRNAVRQADIVGRPGGDEFVVLLNDCTPGGAAQAVERILQSVRSEPVVMGKCSVTVFISAGLLYVPASCRSQPLDVLVKAADELMYQAKARGGNRTQSRTLES